MGVLGFLGSLISSMAETTVRQRQDVARKIEREHPDMDKHAREKLDEFNRLTDKMSDRFGVSSGYSSDGTAADFGGKTIDQWDSEWQSIGMLKDADLSPYNHCVGLYQHVIRGEVMYVGRAIELNNGGFRKRLSDYRRASNSARKHTSGRIIHEHLDEIETYILVVGSTPEAVAITRRLEGAFIRRYHNPPWNKQINI